MKFALICLFTVGSFAFSFAEEFTVEDAIAAAKHLTVEEFELLKAELPAAEKREITGPDGRPVDLANPGLVQVDPKSHFCCKQEHIQNKLWNTKEHTRVISEYRLVTFKYKTGYTKCGGLGWSRCSLYKEGYSTELFTYTQVAEVEDVRFCPDEHITCCHGYTKFADGNCVRLNDFKEQPQLVDSLCRLARLGLVASNKKPTNCPSDS